MTIPALSLAFFVMAVIFGVMVVRGLVTGRARTRYVGTVARAENPVGYWFVQAFNTLLALVCIGGAIVGITGI